MPTDYSSSLGKKFNVNQIQQNITYTNIIIIKDVRQISLEEQKRYSVVRVIRNVTEAHDSLDTHLLKNYYILMTDIFNSYWYLPEFSYLESTSCMRKRCLKICDIVKCVFYLSNLSKIGKRLPNIDSFPPSIGTLIRKRILFKETVQM